MQRAMQLGIHSRGELIEETAAICERPALSTQAKITLFIGGFGVFMVRSQALSRIPSRWRLLG